jgi:hypothetical protein
MAKTGEKCSTTGRYNGRCIKIGHTEQATFHSGDTFTPCSSGNCASQRSSPGGGSAMEWTWAGR